MILGNLNSFLILFSLLQLYSTWRIIPSTHMRPIHLGIVLMLAYLLYPARRKSRKDRLPWYDAALAVLSLAVYLYQVINFSKIAMQFGYTDFQLYLGLAGIIRFPGQPRLHLEAAGAVPVLYAGRRFRHAGRRFLHVHLPVYPVRILSGKNRRRRVLY